MKNILTLKEASKEAKIRILKNRESHQSVYDDLQTKVLEGKTNLANALGNIPSIGKLAKFAWLRWIYISIALLYALLCCIALFGIISVGYFGIEMLFLVITIVAIVCGVIFVFRFNPLILRSVSFFLVYRTYRVVMSMLRVEGDQKYLILIDVVFYVLLIVLGFILIAVLKTKYETKKVTYVENDVKLKKSVAIFEVDEKISNPNLIDQ